MTTVAIMKLCTFAAILSSVVRSAKAFSVPPSLLVTPTIPTAPSSSSAAPSGGRCAASTRVFEAASATLLETTYSKSNDQQEFDYNWKDQWYALTFASYVATPSESAEATPAAVFGQPLVLWKSKDDGEIFCANDVCPHRSSALSEGRVRDGRIECLYHGWQFNGTANGACESIPQLEKNAEIPKRACLKMKECRVVEGIVWVWMGDEKPTTDPPMQGDILDPVEGTSKGVYVNDFQIDLPYDHSYLVENLIDPAHIPISHDRTPGGGLRENAQAYEMIVDDDSVHKRGFTGRFRHAAAAPEGPWTELKFEAPGIIRQFGRPREGISFGAALHCMPLALGRSRLLFRVYIGGLPWIAKTIIRLKPKAFRDLNSCKILEQDVGLITSQEDHFARNSDRALADDFLLLRSSDRFVGEYRKWMDRVGAGMPWFQGLAKRSPNVANHLTGNELAPALNAANHRSSGQNSVETRYHRHVVHCPTTRKMLRRVQVLKRFSTLFSAAALAVTAGLAPTAVQATASLLTRRIFSALFLSVLASVGMFAWLGSLEQRFYVSFKRRDQLRTESGL